MILAGSHTWTDDEIVWLRLLWEQTDPVLPQAQIADEIGVTRQQLSSKARWLGLVRRSHDYPPAKPVKPVIVPDAPIALGPLGKAATLAVLPALSGVTASASSDMARAPNCQWPMWQHSPGARGPHVFCSADLADSRQPYCAEHMARAYRSSVTRTTQP